MTLVAYAVPIATCYDQRVGCNVAGKKSKCSHVRQDVTTHVRFPCRSTSAGALGDASYVLVNPMNALPCPHRLVSSCSYILTHLAVGTAKSE